MKEREVWKMSCNMETVVKVLEDRQDGRIKLKLEEKD